MSKIELPPISRRNFLRIVGGGSAALVATVCSPSVPSAEQPHQKLASPLPSRLPIPGSAPSPQPTKPSSFMPTAVPTNTPERKITITNPELIPESVIKEQVRILGILPSQTEQALWANNYRVPQEPQPITPATVEEVKKRIDRVRARMERSQNPHFRQAARLAGELTALKQFIFTPVVKKHLLSMAPIMTTSNIDRRLIYDLGINIDHMVNKFDDISIAIGLTHEMEHIKNMRNYVNSIPVNTPPEEIIAMYNRDNAGRKKLIEEEVRGFAAGARAYIYQYGLLNGQGEIRNVHKELRTDGLLFALYEQNEKNQDWQDQIELIVPLE